MKVTIACDLRHLLGAARDQGARPTCMAFAASDAHAGMRPGWEPLSCEYAFYHAVERDGGHPEDGASLDAMLAAVREDGQPPEQVWPYLPVVPADVAQWKPPGKPHPLFRRDGRYGRASVDELLARLDADTPVIVTMCLSAAFFRPDGGGVIASDESPDPTIRHAVVAVGYGKRGDERLVLIRNSWGLAWGVDGHGWASERYLAGALLGVAELTEDLTNVSADRVAENVRGSVA